MIQTVTSSFDIFGGDIQHFVTAHDEKGVVIDLIEIIERHGRVIKCKSILE